MFQGNTDSIKLIRIAFQGNLSIVYSDYPIRMAYPHIMNYIYTGNMNSDILERIHVYPTKLKE